MLHNKNIAPTTDSEHNTVYAYKPFDSLGQVCDSFSHT